MRRRLYLSLVMTILFAIPVAAQNVDEIIAKHIKARGGMDKIKAAKSIRMTGKMTIGPGIEAPVTLEQKRPNSVRIEVTAQGLSVVQAYDGKTGWQINPFEGKKDPVEMSGDELKDVIEMADVDGPLVDYKEKGHKVELVGKEQVDGTDAYKLKVTLKSGDVRFVYLDADSHLEIKSDGKRKIRGSEVETEFVAGDYKAVEGVMYPFSLEFGAKGSQQKQNIAIEKIEVNPSLDDARFKMPVVNKPEVKAEEKKPEAKPTGQKPPIT